MKIKISTEVLKELTSRSVKGMGNSSSSKAMPITSLMLIKLEHNILTLVTTDGLNYLYIKKEKVEGDDFYVVVQGSQFSKLISKMTCDTIELSVSNNFLEVKGNGSYKIDIPLDQGEYIKYPDSVAELNLNEETRYEVHLSTVHAVLNSCKSSVAVTMEDPEYTGYYFGDRVLTTNDYVMSCMDVDVFEDKKVLVTPSYMDLLGLMTQEKFSSYLFEDKIVCISPDCIVYGELMEKEYLDNFPAEDIEAYFNTKMESSCKLNKLKLLSVLDRISLFVGAYDDGAVQFTFQEEGLLISSKQLSGSEIIEYSDSKNFKPFTGLMDVKQFEETIKSNPDDEIYLEYGNENAIKLVTGNLSFLIAWIVEEEVDENEGEVDENENKEE